MIIVIKSVIHIFVRFVVEKLNGKKKEYLKKKEIDKMAMYIKHKGKWVEVRKDISSDVKAEPPKTEKVKIDPKSQIRKVKIKKGRKIGRKKVKFGYSIFDEYF